MRTTGLAVLVGFLLLLSGCGGGGDNSSTGPAQSAATCSAGQSVKEPATKGGVPPCAKSADATLTYGCYPNGKRKGSFYAVEIGGRELYGVPGGKWVQAKSPNKLDNAAVKKIGCC